MELSLHGLRIGVEGVTDGFLSAWFRSRCIECEGEARPGEGVCGGCWDPPVLQEPRCGKCGAGVGLEEKVCGRCFRGRRWRDFQGVWSSLEYKGPVAALVRAVKFQGYARWLDQLEPFCRLPSHWEGEGAWLVPVPLSRRGWWERGFNQAEVLACFLGQRHGLRVEGALLEHRGGIPQSALSGWERERNVKGRFRVTAAVPKNVILVDDILTTGSTLAASGRALCRAGVRNLWGWTLCRTTGPN